MYIHTMYNISMKYKIIFLAIVMLWTVSSFAQMAQCKGKYFGNVIGNSVPNTYGDLWNQVTPENGTKWGIVEKTKGVYDWSEADISYNWAKANGALFKFHTLVWGSQMPDWVSTATTAELTASIENYMIAAANHFTPMGGLDMIDVLNEPANPVLPDYMKDALTAGYKAEPANALDLNNPYGWAIWPYQLARKYFPFATLLTNEYNIEENWQGMRAPYIVIINAIKNAPNLTNGAKNLIDGVGLQCHGVHQLTAANFKACLDEVWEGTGLPIHISEFDQVADEDEAKQKNVYATLIPVAWEHPHVAGITLWGYVQGSTWLKGNNVAGSYGTDSGIQYAPTYTANPSGDRPALTWLKQYLSTQPDLICCPNPAPLGSCILPSISITAPASLSVFQSPEAIPLTVSASDADGTIVSVAFFEGSNLLGTVTTLPYTFSWENFHSGTYYITAVATDNNGTKITSQTITIIIKLPKNYVYECDGCATDSWTSVENWTPAAIPSVIDTAYIRTGEVKIYDDISALVRIEPNGIFRMIGNYTVPAIELQGGTIKVYTSNKMYGLTSNIDVQQASTIWAGSLDTSVFWLEGTLRGSGDLTKTYTGILDLNVDATEFSGNWFINDGTFRVANSLSIGENTVTLSDVASIDIATTGVFIFNVILGNGSINLNNDLTVKKFSIAGSSLTPGTYTATDYPGIITGSGTLSVLGNRDCTGLEDGTAYYDNCGTCVGGTTGLTACLPTIFQAEAMCQFDGTVDTSNIGFTGAGYVNTVNQIGSQATMYVAATDAETVKLFVRYANGTETDRDVSILLNGTEINPSFSMPPTGSWTSYLSVQTDIQLYAGANKIEFIANTNGGIANLDYFESYSNAVFSNCPQIQTIELNPGWNLVSTNLYPYTDSVNNNEACLISNMFSGLDVQVIKTTEAYWRSDQPEIFNSLKTMEPAKGYLVYMNSSGMMTISGIPFPTTGFKFPADFGWNIIGCPYQSTTAFSAIFDETNCSEIKNFDGFWIPNDPMNSIQNMEIGKAYFCKQ